ncbi:MAG: histidine phosphatase family protein [Halioglobus sp.]
MKTLHLLRHAKSSWQDDSLSDRERGLNSRGKKDAPLMGTELSKILSPTTITVSPATRAQLTLKGLCSAWPELASADHETDEALYTFSSGDLEQWIATQEDSRDTLFIIGHNPALTDLVNTLTRTHSLANLPTAGYVKLRLDIDQWDQLLHCVAVIDESLTPKQLKKTI